MIDAQLIEELGIIKVFPESSLEAEDFDRLELLLDSWLQRGEEFKGLMIQTQHFPGWEDLSAMLHHFSFVKHHHDKVHRVALVTDSILSKFLPGVAGIFVNAEVRGFGFHQAEDAEAWLTSASD